MPSFEGVMSMKRLSLLFILAVLLVSTAIAGQTADTFGQFKARQAVASISETNNTNNNTPTFFPVGDFRKIVAVGQTVTIRMVDFSGIKDTQFFVCRDVGDKCYDPIDPNGTVVDTIPDANKIKYTVVQTDPHGEVLWYGDINILVRYVPPSEPFGYVTNSASAEAIIVQPCDNLPPGTNCPMYYVTEPNYLRIKTVGVYPANTVMHILATAKDGSVGRPVMVSTGESTDGLYITMPMVTRNRTSMSLTTWNPENREFQTAVDIIAPLAPTGPTSAVR